MNNEQNSNQEALKICLENILEAKRNLELYAPRAFASRLIQKLEMAIIQLNLLLEHDGEP